MLRTHLIMTILAIALLADTATTDATSRFHTERHTMVVTPAGWKSARALGAFSCSYVDWGVIKSEGRQIQFGSGKTVPAVAIADGKLHVVFDRPHKLYHKAEFWLSAGPELVRQCKPVPSSRWRKRFPTLDTERRTVRVAICTRGDEFWFVSVYGSLDELRSTCLKSGAEHAVNLDGGSCAVFRYGKNGLVGPHAKLQVLVLPRKRQLSNCDTSTR